MGVGTAITKRDWILRIFHRSCHRTCPSWPVGVAISYGVDCHLGGALLGFARCEGGVYKGRLSFPSKIAWLEQCWWCKFCVLMVSCVLVCVLLGASYNCLCVCSFFNGSRFLILVTNWSIIVFINSAFLCSLVVMLWTFMLSGLHCFCSCSCSRHLCTRVLP